MSTTLIRIRTDVHRRIMELAKAERVPMVEYLDRALKDYEKKLFFESLSAQYAAVRADPKARAEEDAEQKLWDTTLKDGLTPVREVTKPTPAKRRRKAGTKS